MTEALETLPIVALEPYAHKPKRAKYGGRGKGVPNRDRALSIERINRLADPIGGLCAIAIGRPVLAAPMPGAAAELVTPTMADRLTALKALADKVLPDLKSVEAGDGAGLISVVLNLDSRRR